MSHSSTRRRRLSKGPDVAEACSATRRFKYDFLVTSQAPKTGGLRGRLINLLGYRDHAPTHQGNPLTYMSAPLAFISHSSRDKQTALSLARALRARGIEIWIDHDGTRYVLRITRRGKLILQK